MVKRSRSTSINPVVYPSWWGQEEEVDPFYYRRDRKNIPKRLKSADIHKAKVHRNVARHCEDTLDRRLRQVHERPNVQAVAYRYPNNSGETQDDSMAGPLY